MQLRSRLLLGTVVASLALAGSSAAIAQDGIEVVTVTAAKRVQDVQDVPISMNVVSQKELEKYNIADLKDLSLQIPGMVVLKTNNANTITLRGFGSSAANPAIDQTVALYMDGIFAGRARLYMAPFFDVSRIEVLRGPQGALIGKNTAAGAVSITTNDPTDTFEASATASYLIDRQGVDVFGYVSGPVTDDLSVRLSGKYVLKTAGWIKNIATGKDIPTSDTKQGRLSLHWQPEQGIDIKTKFQVDSIRTDQRHIVGFPQSVLRNQIVPIKNHSGLFGVEDFDRQTSYHFSNNANFDVFGDLTLVSVSGFESFKSDALGSLRHNTPENLTTNFVESFTQGSQEFRLVSPAEQTVSWIVGAFVDYSFHELRNRVRYVDFPLVGSNGQATSDYSQSAATYSAYGTATWNVTDDIRLIGGARVTRVSKHGRYVLREDFNAGVKLFNNLSALNQGLFPTTNGFPLIDQTRSEDSFDPSITGQYDVTDDIMVYAGWSRGSKGGTFQGATRTVTPTTFFVPQEKSTNYEIGFKSIWWDWLTVNAAAYVLEFDDLQGGRFEGTPPSLFTTTVGGAVSQGVEWVIGADLGQWVEGLRFNGSGNYIDAHYTDYPFAFCTFAASQPAGGTCVNGVFTTGPQAGQPFDLKGFKFTSLPVWQGSVELAYTRPIFDGVKIDVSVTADMMSMYWDDAGLYNPAYGIQTGNTKLNFRIGLAEIEDAWSIALIGRNVTNVLTTTGAVPPNPLISYTIDELQSYSVQGSVKF